MNKAFNELWAEAYNLRSQLGITDWAMQHDDIRPQPGWADVLIDERRARQVDVMSAVAPLKDDRGLTSTGIRNAKTGQVRRLTMTELMRLPETFGLDALLANGVDVPGERKDKFLIVNTGLWVCDFRRTWIEAFPGFSSRDGLIRSEDGRLQAASLPEDWLFSEWAWRHGLQVRATRRTPLVHVEHPAMPIGENNRAFPNGCVWGDWETDHGDDSNS